MPAPFTRGLLTALVLLGVSLRAWAYLGNPPFWLDEILVARNVTGTSLRHLLTRPLELDQVAPLGFLAVEKLAALMFGGTELALRLFPFLSAVAGVLLFRSLAERALDGGGAPFAMGLYAVGIPLIKHGAEVKQYETDATVPVGLMLLALPLKDRDNPTGGLCLAGLIGFAVIWFSQPSVLVMGGIGLALALE